ncbi:MAG: M23 family metallopeptidase [bacterium]
MSKKWISWFTIAAFLLAIAAPAQAITTPKSRVLTEEEMAEIVGKGGIGEYIVGGLVLAAIGYAIFGGDDNTPKEEDAGSVAVPNDYGVIEREGTIKYPTSDPNYLMHPKYYKKDGAKFAAQAEKAIEAAKKIKFYYPVSQYNRITSGFRWLRGTKVHAGVDVKVGEGTPVMAAHEGIVTYTGKISGYGNAVYLTDSINDDNGKPVGKLTTVYGHLRLKDGVLPAEQAKLNYSYSEGNLIGLSGNTGVSTGPHLHFEVRYLKPNATGYANVAEKGGWTDYGFCYANPAVHGLNWEQTQAPSQQVQTIEDFEEYMRHRYGWY